MDLVKTGGGSIIDVIGFGASHTEDFVISSTKLTNGSLPNIIKAVNANLPHAIKQGVYRGVFATKEEATASLKNLTKQISRNGFFQNA